MKKRLLIVSQHFWPENFRVSDMAAGFVERGFAVDVLCGLPNYPRGEYFAGYRYSKPRRQEYAGVQVFRSGEIRRKNNSSLRIFLNYISFPLFSLANLHRLNGRQYDAVFCYETSPVLMILPAIAMAKRRRIPLTTYVLDLWPENLYSVLPVRSPLLRRLAQAVSNWHYRRCDRLVALSDGMAERLEKIPPKRGRHQPGIAVIPQYCEDFYATEIRDEALGARFKRDFTLVFTGNLSPAQDMENLFSALELVRGKLPMPFTCLIVGDGMSRGSLETLAKEKGLSDMVQFCGSCPPEDIPRWTGLADALFLGLSSSESLGLTVPGKLQSYCAAGRPILAALNDEAAREAAKTGAALLSPAGDANALAQNLLRLAAMPEAERQIFGDAGRRYYQENYRRELLLGKLLTIIFDEEKSLPHKES